MHVLVAGLYAVCICLAMAAYCVSVGIPLHTVISIAPFLVSGCVVGIFVVEAVLTGLNLVTRIKIKLGKN